MLLRTLSDMDSRSDKADGVDEPSPFLDPGPYLSKEQAADQVAAVLHGIPGATDGSAPGFAGELVLMEALLRADVEVGGWEDVARQEIVRILPVEVVQVIAGWLIRARLASVSVSISPPRHEG